MESIKVYELYDFWYTPFWEYVFIGLVGILFIGIVGGLIFWLYVRKKKKKKLASWVQALMSLEQLKPDDFVGFERYKEYYVRLTSILKEYFCARYSLNLFDKTDLECIKILRPYLHSSTELGKLEVIMSGAVWAKFAPEDVIQQKMARDLEDSIAIIKSTRRE
jgi:hypothetical protein